MLTYDHSGEIRRFLAESPMNQTAWLQSIGINNNSFNRFMTGKYKDQWSACDNGTYWAAARDLEKRRRQEKRAAKTAPKKKRKATDDAGANNATGASGGGQPSKKQRCKELMSAIAAFPGVGVSGPVFDNCDEVRRKINRFINETGATQASFCRAIAQGEPCQGVQLTKFLQRKGEGDGAASKVYRLAYAFFEKRRLRDGAAKTPARLANEQRQGPSGFPLQHDNGMRWVFGGM